MRSGRSGAWRSRSRARPRAADQAKVNTLAQAAVAAMRGAFMSVAFREYGTLMYMDMGMTLGDAPAKYYSQSRVRGGEGLRPGPAPGYAVENYACRGCPSAAAAPSGTSTPDLPVVDGPEYETVNAFGPLVLNHDMDTIIKANHLCNAHGLDTISAGVSVAYAFHLYDRGVITKRPGRGNKRRNDPRTGQAAPDLFQPFERGRENGRSGAGPSRRCCRNTTGSGAGIGRPAVRPGKGFWN